MVSVALAQFDDLRQCYNIHTVAPGRCYRSKLIQNQDDLRFVLREYGIKTVVNVCGPCPQESWYGREKTTCAELGVEHCDVTLQPESFSDLAQIALLRTVFANKPAPFLIHCMRGADRTGEAVALFLRYQEQAPVEVALAALDWQFEHNPFTHWHKRAFIKHLYAGDGKRGAAEMLLPVEKNTSCRVVEPGLLYQAAYTYPWNLHQHLSEYGIKAVVVLEPLLGKSGMYASDYKRICKYHQCALYQVPLPELGVEVQAVQELRAIFDRHRDAGVLVMCLSGGERCSEALAWWYVARNALTRQRLDELFSLRYDYVPAIVESKYSYFVDLCV